MDRRHGNVLREIMVPLVVSVVVGVGGSYMSTQITVSTVATRVDGMKEDLSELRGLMSAVQQNQMTLAARGEWIKSVEERLQIIRDEISVQRSSLYKLQDEFRAHEKAEIERLKQ